MEEEYQCECLKCGKQFSSKEIVEVSYSEYPGAFKQTDHASPCCNWHFTEVESDPVKKCPKCNGKGFFEGDFTHEGTPSYGEGECFACNGTGEVK